MKILVEEGEIDRMSDKKGIIFCIKRKDNYLIEHKVTTKNKPVYKVAQTIKEDGTIDYFPYC